MGLDAVAFASKWAHYTAPAGLGEAVAAQNAPRGTDSGFSAENGPRSVTNMIR